MMFLIGVPVFIGLAALGYLGMANYAQSGGQYLLPYEVKGVMETFVWVVVVGFLGQGVSWSLDALRGDSETLERLPEKAEVIPVYQYQGQHYEAPITTAGDLHAEITTHSLNYKNVQAFPSSVPLRQAQPMYEPAPERSYGEPEYMVDGTLIGYRYFDRDLEGNLKSVSAPDSFGGNWGEGKNSSKWLPDRHNSFGLWAAYRPDSPFLDAYEDRDVKAAVGFHGQVVFGEKGFRAEHGDVIQILEEKQVAPEYKPLKFHQDRSKGRF